MSDATPVRKDAGFFYGRGRLVAAGLLCFAVMALVLLFTADPTPTTPSSRRLFGLWRIRSILPALGLSMLGVGFLLAALSRASALAFTSTMVGILGTFALLEAIGATGFVSWAELFRPRPDPVFDLGSKRAANVDRRSTTYQDTSSGWGLQSDPIPFHFRTDRHGFRNHADRPTADVILLGDSFLVGGLVPVEKLVGVQLETLTGRTVMHVALVGISPQAEHELLWGTGLDLRGKRVVQFIFEGNDLLDSRKFRLGAKGASEGGRTLFDQIWRLVTDATDRQRDMSGLRVCSIRDQIYTFLWGRNSFDGVESEAKEITDAIERAAARVRAAGGHYSVAFIPTKLRVLAGLCQFPPEGAIQDATEHLGPLHAHILAWGSAAGVPVLDLTEPLTRAALGGRVPWFWGDSHWNEIGHEEAAKALDQWPAFRE
ncbi:MAG: alginate O-acetyltransferase AlgX-related protein [Hyphomicrobium sp.]